MKHLPIAFALMALAACGERQGAYPPQYEFGFTQACEARTPGAGVCACIWENIEREVPRAEFDALERLDAAARAEHPLTRRIEGFALSCARAPAATMEPAAP